jgi:hypothetical protein
MSPLLPPDPPARPPTRTDHLLVAVMAVASAAGAIAASGEPTGWEPADLAWRAGLGALAVLAGAKARRWTWLVAAGVGAVASPDLLTAAPALAGLVVAVANFAVGRRTRVVGGLVLGLAVQSLLRLELAEPFGLASLVAAAGLAPAFVSGYRRSRPKAKRAVRAGVLAFGLIAIGLAIGQAIAIVDARSSVATGIDAARSGFDAARSGDEQGAVDEFEAAADAFAEANDALTAPWASAGRAIPLLGQHAVAVQEITEAGTDLADTAAGATSDAPLDELQFQDGVLDLTRVAAFAEPLDRAEAALLDAEAVVDDVDDGWLVPPLADRVDEFADEVGEALPQAEIARRGVEVAPQLFGGDGIRRYFIAFVTPAEQRPLGGFMGNFGVLTANGGDVTLARSDEIAGLGIPLTRAGATITGPPDYVARYDRYRPSITPGDVTLSPDFPSVSQVIAELFPQAGGQPLDGVILVDPIALQALLNFTGPITVEDYPVPLTSENAADVLLREQYLSFEHRDDRKDFLEEASRKTFEALTSGDLPGPREVGETLGPMVDQGRLLVHSFHPEEQAFFDRLGLDGAFPQDPGGDLLAVTTSNSGHNKGDSFLTRAIDYEATVDPETGVVEATATVTLTNAAPPGGLPDVVIGVNQTESTPNLPDLPPGTNLMYLSLYSPLALSGAEVDGQDLPVEAQLELGVNVYSQAVQVAPGGTTTVVFHLAGGVDLTHGYRFTWAGQPTINPDEVAVDVGVGQGTIEAGRGFEQDGDRVRAAWDDGEDHRLTADLQD